MFKILDLYIGRSIVTTTFVVLASLVSLSSVIRFVEQLRAVGRGTYELSTAFYYVLLGVPRDIELFFAMSSLLGALIALGVLASSSELVVMQAAGYSKLKIGGSVLKTAMPLMLIVLLIGEWGAPQAQKMARELRSFSISGGKIVSVRSGVWAKDGNDFIFIAKAEDDALEGLNIWTFDDNKKLSQTTFAESANYIGDSTWRLENVKITHLDNREVISGEDKSEHLWQTTLEPDKLAIVKVEPEELAISGLYEYVSYLKASDQDASRYELAFWRKLSQPLSVGVMMLLALSFVFGPLRSVTMGARVVSGVIAGFAFYISSEFFGPVTLVYGIPPVIGAIAPSLVCLIIAISVLQRKL